MLHPRRSLLGALALGSLVPPAAAQGPGVFAEMDALARLRRAHDALAPGSLRERVAISRSLERAAGLGIGLSAGRAIVVNIAAAELIAYENGREALRSRVIVGTTRTPTPQLATFVTSARTNPPWYVPASIEPEIRAAGAVGFRTFNGRLMQPPGPTNPLGPVRVGLLDSDGIFLHGTNSPHLFARTSRTLSHGCVRVERIRELTAWLLDQAPATVEATIASGRTFELMPTQEVQVMLGYLTAWVDGSGRLTLHGDPYGLDAPDSRRAPIRRVRRPVVPLPAEPGTEDNPL
jgi:murein L,D-transpeptidase YcbB/YkuD